MNRLLHVEDEPDIQAVARMALEDLGGFSVEIAGSGVEAIAKAQACAPDLILMDVMMPGMDGPSTLSALRRNPATAKIPVIFMTAKVQHHEIAQYLAMGVLGVISKPFDPMLLSDQVVELWKKECSAPR